MNARIVSLSIAFFLAACGGKTETTGAPDSTPGGDAGVDATSDTPTPTPCPATAPGDGSACGKNGLVCGYGDDPRWSCRTVATCNGATWSVTPPPSTCTPLPPTTCPATLADANGKDCTPKDAYCGYDGLACHCTNCVEYPDEHCSGPLTWHCETPSTDPGCPAAMPNAGTACTSEGRQCTYGCERDHARTCTGGVWTISSSPYGCPVSSKTYKRDIHYLGLDELRGVADRVESLRLATWAYVDSKIATGKRLGIIAEEAPHDALDPRGDRIDLYGYTSMAIAAVQVSAHDVDALRAEVEAMRAEIAELRKTCAAK